MKLKHILIFLIFIGSFHLMKAQDPGSPVVYTAPAAFQTSEEITIYAHPFGTPLYEHNTDIYMVLDTDIPVNGTPELCELDSASGYYYFTLTPDSYFGTTVDSISLYIQNEAGDTISAPETVKPFDFTTAQGQLLTTEPAMPNYAQNVSLIWDATQSDQDDLTGVDPLYLWAWNNAESLGDAPNQGSWGNYSPSAKLTKIDENIWRKDFVPQEYWETNVKMTQFGCLIASSNGDLQTSDQTVILYPPPRTEPLKIAAAFPQKFTQEDVVTIMYDTNLDNSLEDADNIYMFTSVNEGELYNPLPGNWLNYSLQQKDMAKLEDPDGDGIYTITFIPEEYYPIPDDFQIETLNIKFRNSTGTIETQETFNFNVCY
jgi:hypothetical protein